MLKVKNFKKANKLIQEFNWDLHLIYNNELLDLCNITDQEKEYFNLMVKLATRCRLDNNADKKVLTLEYVIPETDIQNMCKAMTEFVTSALIQQIDIDIFNMEHNKLFTVFCKLKNHVPDWHITFGTKEDVLKLICEYEIDNLKMA